MDFMSTSRQTTYPVYAEGNGGQVRLNRRGEFVVADFITQAALDGRLFCASAGSISTPITWTATAVSDQTKAAVMVSVPVGTTIIPVSIQLYMEAFGTDAQFECAAAIGSGGVSAGGTATTVTNMRSDAPNTSNCTVTSDLTGGTALTTNISEFWRSGLQFAITKTASSATASAADPYRFVWSCTDGLCVPVVVGLGQLVVTQGSQAGTGFCKVIWVELPTVNAI